MCVCVREGGFELLAKKKDLLDAVLCVSNNSGPCVAVCCIVLQSVALWICRMPWVLAKENYHA